MSHYFFSGHILTWSCLTCLRLTNATGVIFNLNLPYVPYEPKYKICWNCNSDTRTSLSASCEKEPLIPRRYCSNAWRLTLVRNKVIILLMAWLPSTKRSEIPPWEKENAGSDGIWYSLEGTCFHIFFSGNICFQNKHPTTSVILLSCLNKSCTAPLCLVCNKTYPTKPNCHLSWSPFSCWNCWYFAPYPHLQDPGLSILKANTLLQLGEGWLRHLLSHSSTDNRALEKLVSAEVSKYLGCLKCDLWLDMWIFSFFFISETKKTPLRDTKKKSNGTISKVMKRPWIKHIVSACKLFTQPFNK